jgi:hypothetical protein
MNSIGQFFLAFLVGWCVYMSATFATVYDGTQSLVKLTLLGLVVTSFALMPVFVVGLPIRLIDSVERWWRAHWWVAIAVAVVAVGMLYASWLPGNRSRYFDHNLDRAIDSPHPWLGIGGWLLVMFAAGHFFPPTRRIKS